MSNQPPNQLAVQRQSFVKFVEADAFKKQLALALPKHVTADKMLRILLTQMNKNPGLYECTRDSILGGIMTAGQLGLEIDGKKASLVPFNDRKSGGKIATLIVGYQGFIELAYRHPKVAGVRAKVVYEKDLFDYDEGLHPRLVHKPYEGDDDPGSLKYAWAICNIDGGGATFVVVNRREVMKAKESARGADRTDSPWKTHEASMWMKTAVRRLAPFMPQSSELSEALNVDTEGQRALDLQGMAMAQGLVGTPPGPGSTAIEDAASNTGEGAPIDVQTQSEPAGETSGEAGTGEPKKEEPKKGAPTLKDLRTEVTKSLAKLNAGKSMFVAHLVEAGKIPAVVPFDELDAATLLAATDDWETIAAALTPKRPE